ncbi:SpoIID/LytB domain-containing protein [Neobacillus notoginsengisoli]|uniref:SpoIID/LytB domain-containing protein n=1 Tax=Neobacillus notoginsengisoli TaxID=1578198 RepID=A0A417YQY6_9BACI|nr:SpoIID/LytB domain-containing protein [Neobacillus notoginsengisoli]RHW37274.1 SpoIID/LytB domain-containing protein [Neobacillus notoginsengisoli]
MKKLLTALAALIILFVQPAFSEAATGKAYPKKISVIVQTGQSASIYLAGNYQLKNLQTGQTAILTYVTLNLNHDGSTVVATYPGGSQKSTSGFDVEEVTTEIAQFTTETEMRSGATTGYPIVQTFKAGEGADYINSFTNAAGEVWYNVRPQAGKSAGWVIAKNVKRVSASTLNTSRVNSGTSYRGSYHVKPTSNKQIQLVNFLDMEDYLKGVVPNEMPALWHKEALKAQAIAARSYASHDLLLYDSARSQVYKGYSGENSLANTAIKETEGLVVRYNGKVVQTFFYSTSGGRTANAWDVWGSSKTTFPYLASVEDKYEASPYSNWTETFTPASILPKFGLPVTATLYDITTENNGANGEVTGVTVKTSAGDKTIRGNEGVIRGLFPVNKVSGYTTLYSSWFTLKSTKTQPGVAVQTPDGVVDLPEMKGQMVLTPTGEITLSDSEVQVQTSSGIVSATGGTGEVTSITVNGKGFGHRIGMSQYGAKGYAENGMRAADIMKHYFPGTTVSK